MITEFEFGFNTKLILFIVSSSILIADWLISLLASPLLETKWLSSKNSTSLTSFDIDISTTLSGIPFLTKILSKLFSAYDDSLSS